MPELSQRNVKAVLDWPGVNGGLELTGFEGKTAISDVQFSMFVAEDGTVNITDIGFYKLRDAASVPLELKALSPKAVDSRETVKIYIIRTKSAGPAKRMELTLEKTKIESRSANFGTSEDGESYQLSFAKVTIKDMDSSKTVIHDRMKGTTSS